eukprot:2305376-Prymnesium_polylepis.1
MAAEAGQGGAAAHRSRAGARRHAHAPLVQAVPCLRAARRQCIRRQDSRAAAMAERQIARRIRGDE